MELKQFFIEQTIKTPQVDLNPMTGELIFSGRSIPENPAKIYEPVFEWITHYTNCPKQITNLRLSLEYFNTASIIWLSKIVRTLCSTKEDQNTLLIHLYFDIEEFDSMESDDIRDALAPFLDIVDIPVVNLGIRIYGTDEKGGVLKESMVLI